jgi:hypothetical protein
MPNDLYLTPALKARSRMVAETIRTGRMPPLPYDPEITVPPGALTAEQTRLILRWVKAGAPVEPGVDTPPAAPPPWLLPGFVPDVVWQPPVEHVISSTETSVFRYASLGGPAPEDLWISTVVFRNSTPQIVQHVSLYALPKPLEAYAADPLGEGAGFDSMPDLHAASLSSQPNGRYAYTVVPPGTAWKLPKGWYPVLEVHYASRGARDKNKPAVGLGLARDKGLAPLKTAFLMKTDFTIPPGAASYTLTARRRFQKRVRVDGFKAHMHLRGKSARLLARLPDGSETVLASLPRYATKYQPLLWLDPREFPPGTELIVEMTYDNSAENPLNPDPSAAVRAGRTLRRHEMFKAFVVFDEIPPQ